MALTYVSAGTAVAASGASPTTIATTTALAVGDVLFIAMAYDNSGGGGADPMSGTFTPTPAAGAMSFLSGSGQTGLNDPGSASAGLASRCNAYTVTTAISSGTNISIAWSGTVVVRAIVMVKVSSNAGGTVSYRTSSGSTGTNSVNQVGPGATGTGITTPSVNNGEMVLCYAGQEYGQAITGATNNTNGTWGSIVNVNTGTTTTGMAMGVQGKVVTATATQVFNPTGATTDWIAGALIFTEVLPPSITQAAYRFYGDGTESGSTALAAQDTAPSVGVTLDANLQLRVRLQSTTAVDVPLTDAFQLQWEENASGTWVDVATDDLRFDHYPESNFSTFYTMPGASGYLNVGQSFTGNGEKLSRVDFYLGKTGSPTGNITCTIRAHSGTFGTSSVATGGALATSTSLDVTTIPGAGMYWYRFNFDATFTLTNGTNYVAVLGYSGGDSSNGVTVGSDNTSPTHPGNLTRFISSWTADATQDAMFRIFTRRTTLPTTVVGYDSASLADPIATTNRLGAGTGSFVAGEVSEDGKMDDHGWSANNYTELMFSLALKSADLNNGDTLRFRVLKNGATTDMTYSVTPTINVTKPINETNRPVAITATTTLTEVVKYRDLASDAYLAPRAAVAKTPDPVTMPTTGFVFVMKVRGPVVATGNDQSIVSQNETDGNTSYRVNRDPDNHTAYHAGYPSGTFASGVFLTSNGAWGGRDDNDCLLAWSYVISSGAWTLKKSTDNGVTYPNTSTGTGPTSGLFDSTGPVCIGADSGGASSKFDGRIYWVELRSGVDPLGGTLLWRFDARDWVSGTGWTDPRGNVWTLASAGAVVAQAMTHLAVATVTSTDSLSVPATVPDPPTALVGTPGNAQVALTWSAPADDGGSAITDYIVQYRQV